MCDVIISSSHILFLVDVHDRIELISSFSTILCAFEPSRHHSQRIIAFQTTLVGFRQNHCVPSSFRAFRKEEPISIIIVEHLWSLDRSKRRLPPRFLFFAFGLRSTTRVWSGQISLFQPIRTRRRIARRSIGGSLARKWFRAASSRRARLVRFSVYRDEREIGRAHV